MFWFITSSTSAFSTRLRASWVRNANSTVNPKPSRTNETMMRLRSRRRSWRALRAGVAAVSASASWLGDPVADAVTGLDQRGRERLVDHGAQAVDMHAQRIRIRQLLTPDPGFQLLAGDHRRR